MFLILPILTHEMETWVIEFDAFSKQLHPWTSLRDKGDGFEGDKQS
jgi:hypothetical protein